MVTGKHVRERIERLAPPALAESWDNVGWQVGHDDVAVHHVHLALDLNDAVLAEARDAEADLIVTHHPLLFQPLHQIDPRSPIGRLLTGLLKEDRAVFSAHTNLDAVRGGVNGALAAALALPDPVAPLQPVDEAPQNWGFGAICETDTLTTSTLATRVHTRLGTPRPRITPGATHTHRRIALLGGSGAAFLEAAADAGCTCFITGELKYHDGQNAQALGLTVIEADHYYSEAPVLPALAEWLRPLDVSVTISDIPTTPFAPDWEEFE